MGILDDAIKEHLELKRQSGAGPDDLQKLENEAFGPIDDSDLVDEPISDEAAEAATQFMKVEPGDQPAAPPIDAPSQAPDAPPQAPETAAEPPASEESPEPSTATAPETAESPFIQDAPIESSPPEPRTPPEQDAPPEADAMEHEIISAPESGDPDPPSGPERESKGPNTEERHAISEHPTELYDVSAEMSAGQESPSEEDLYDAEASEPRLVPPEPVGESLEVSQPEAEDASDSAAADPDASAEDVDDRPGDIGAEAELALGEEEEDDFFSEQSLSDELDQALDAPDLSTPEASPTPPQADPPATEVYVRESEHPSEPDPEPTDDEPEAAPEAEDDESEGEVATPPEPAPAAEPTEAAPEPAEEPAPEPDAAAPEPDQEPAPEADPAPEEGEGGGNFYNVDEDVLEETPDFLQDTPEHDRLWFEQKPPKDFDFDD